MIQVASYSSERGDTKNKVWEFEFTTTFRGKVFRYLATNTDTSNWKAKYSKEEWHNNFSTFFDIENPDGTSLGTIGFSIAGISLFDPALENRQDHPIPREDKIYQDLERIEIGLRNSRELTDEDKKYIRELWDSYNGQ